jgi:hypothetical protein
MLRSKGILVIGAIVVGLLWWGAARASEVAIHSIVANPAEFDHQNVTVVGSIADLKETTSHAGNDYTTFQLQDTGANALTIFIWGHPVLTDGENVRVNGVFETEHRAGRYTFYNEVEAASVVPSP